jgi:hypothetical protein
MGTRNLTDWLVNINIAHTPAFGGQLHSGFLSRAKSIPLDEILELANGKPIYFVGHSLGGAIAQICALLCCNVVPVANCMKQIYSISFGGPYIGTEQVKQFIASKFGAICLENNFLTIVNEEDCIPGVLNLVITLSKTTKRLQEGLQGFQTFLDFIKPAFNNSTAGFILSNVSVPAFFKAIQNYSKKVVDHRDQFKPVGKYLFIKRRDGVLNSNEYFSSSPTGNASIHKNIIIDGTIRSVNLENHRISSYSFNYSALHNIISFGNDNINILPNSILTFIKKLKEINNGKYLYLKEKVLDSFLLPPKTPIVLSEVDKIDFHPIASLLLRNVENIVGFISPYELLTSHFNSISNRSDINVGENLFDEVKTTFTVESQYQDTYGESASIPLFSTKIIEAISLNRIHSLYRLVQMQKSENICLVNDFHVKWSDEIQNLYVTGKSTAVIPGGYLFIINRSDYNIGKIKNFIRTAVKIRRARKIEENIRQLIEAAAIAPNTLVVAFSSKYICDVLESFGCVNINLENHQQITIRKMTELIAENIQTVVSDLKKSHQTQLDQLHVAQNLRMDELSQRFFNNEANMSKELIDMQRTILQSLKENIDAIYNSYSIDTFYHRSEYVDCELQYHDEALTDIQQDFLHEIKKSRETQWKETQTLQQQQRAEIEATKARLDENRVSILKANQLTQIGTAALAGVVVGAISNLLISVLNESIDVYYKKRPIHESLRRALRSVVNGALIGGLSGAVVATVETSAQIARSGTLLRNILEGQGANILTAGFFTVDMLSILFKWYSKKMTANQMKEAMLLSTGRVVFGQSIGYVAAIAATFLCGSPLLGGLAYFAGVYLGTYVGGQIAGWVNLNLIDARRDDLYKAYHTLDLSRDTTIEQVNKRYHALAKRYHPDRLNDPHLSERERRESAEKMMEFNLAVEIIRNFDLLDKTRS